MARSLAEILEEFASNGPSSLESLRSVEEHFGFPLPSDYRSFMCTHDGGEGFVREQYLILWRTVELIEFNRDYEVEKYAPGLVLFGSNGGGEAFAFDARAGENMKIRIVPFIGMSLADAKPVADSFEKLILLLDEHNGSLF